MGIGTYKVHCEKHGLTRTSSEEGVCPLCTPSVVDANVHEHTTQKRGNPTGQDPAPVTEAPVATPKASKKATAAASEE